jgi:hypothetical protein
MEDRRSESADLSNQEDQSWDVAESDPSPQRRKVDKGNVELIG